MALKGEAYQIICQNITVNVKYYTEGSPALTGPVYD